MRKRSAPLMAAMTVGLLFAATGCSSAEPTGDELYQSGADAYFPFAGDLHSVLMAVHDGDWAVDQGQHGALPVSCQRGPDDFGYMIVAARSVVIDDVDAGTIIDSASAALDELGLDVSVSAFGSGDTEERNVVGTGGSLGRAAVTLRPASGLVRVTAQTACLEGSAFDLGVLVFGDDKLDAGRRLPAFEGPGTVPQFYFPADGPLFYDEDGAPILPQPVVTEVPKAPYGDDTP
jgi:hypothetical protein